MLDGNARLNLATFVTTWMEPQAAAAHGRDVRQEHDRQGRVPAHRRDRDALRQHARAGCGTRPTRRRPPARRPPARARPRCSAAWRSSGAGATGCRPPGKPTDQPNMVMGINVQVCWEKFCRYWDVETAAGARWRATASTSTRRGGGEALRREHDRRRPGPRVDLRRQLRAGGRHLRRARPAPGRAPGSTSRCTSTPRRAASSRRSSTPTWSGTSACPGCSRSTPPGTSTGWCTRASAG